MIRDRVPLFMIASWRFLAASGGRSSSGSLPVVASVNAPRHASLLLLLLVQLMQLQLTQLHLLLELQIGIDHGSCRRIGVGLLLVLVKVIGAQITSH